MSFSIQTGAPTSAPSLEIVGTTDGRITFADQTVAPALPAGGISLYSSGGELVYATTTRKITFDSSLLTADRTYEWPNKDGQLIMHNTTDTLSNKTILSADNNIVDATSLNGISFSGTPTIGSVPYYDGANWAPLTLSASAPATYIASGPSAGTIGVSVGSTAGTVTAGNDLRFATPQVVWVKSTLAGAGQFTTITAAIASITDAGPTKQYTVAVYPGIYVESTITVPPWISVKGCNRFGIMIMPTSGSAFTLSSNSTIENLTLIGTGTSTAVNIPSATGVFVANCVATNWNTCYALSAATAATSAVLFEAACSDFVYAVNVNGTALSGSFPCVCNCNELDLDGGASTIYGVYSQGPYAVCSISNAQIRADTLSSGTGVRIEDGSTNTMYNCQVNNYTTGIIVANVGAASDLKASGVNIYDCTNSIHVEHVGATGVFVGIAERSTATITDGTSMSVMFVDPVINGTVLSGNIFYTPNANTDGNHEIGALITYGADLGRFAGGEITLATGLDINVAAGECYVKEFDYPNQHIHRVSWVNSVVTLPASTTSYIFADTGGLDVATSLPNLYTAAVLGRVRTNATGVEFIDRQCVNMLHNFTRDMVVNRDLFGPLYANGTIVSDAGSLQIAISSGKYFYLNNQYNPVGLAPGGTLGYYYHVASAWTIGTTTTIPNATYDDGTGLTALAAGTYVKHSLYMVGDGADEQYLLVHGNAQFATLLDAQNGAGPTPPSYFTEGLFSIAFIIAQQGSTTLTISDAKPRLGSGSTITTAGVTDHGNLTGLLDDDHPQYILTDGTRAFTGSISLGGHNITSVGTVNGVDVAAHASRHLPNGADALATAAPLVSLSSATTNAVGTANSFARSDHTHALDISSVLVSDLGGTLAVTHGGTGQTSLTAGRFLVGADTAAVDLSKVVPAGDVVGTSDVQTLTNKTLLAATNTVYAVGLQAVDVGVTAPTADQVLVATSGTTAAWSLISDSSITGVVTVPHGGTGQSTLTNGNFLIGAGSGAVTTAKVAPSGAVVGTTDTQTLSGKTIVAASNTTVGATHLQATGIATTVPVAGDLLTYSSISGTWGPAAPGATARWTAKHIATVGTNGGALTASTWTTRPITTIVNSTGSTAVTLASNQLTFTSGTYVIRISVPGYRIGLHKARLRNITAGTDLAYGTSASSAGSDTTVAYSHINEIITFGATTVVEVQHWGSRSQSPDGLGIATGIAGTNEIYLDAIIDKIA